MSFNNSVYATYQTPILCSAPQPTEDLSQIEKGPIHCFYANRSLNKNTSKSSANSLPLLPLCGNRVEAKLYYFQAASA